MAGRTTLPREEKLKSRKAIEQLFKEGLSSFQFPFKLIYQVSTLSEEQARYPVQFAVSVPRKKIRSAVDRNLIKRRTREAYRLNKEGLLKTARENEQNILMMFIYVADKVKDFTEIKNSIVKHLNFLENEISA